MKTRSKFFCKVCIFLLLTALTLGFGISASADSVSTTLVTTVPSHFTMDVTIIGNGTIIINGTKLTQSAQISIDRHQAVQICFLPEDDCRVGSVIYNGISLTDKAYSGNILLPALEENAELKVTFVVNSTIPNTGDTSSQNLIYFGVMFIISLLAIITLTVNRDRKKLCFQYNK